MLGRSTRDRYCPLWLKFHAKIKLHFVSQYFCYLWSKMLSIGGESTIVVSIFIHGELSSIFTVGFHGNMISIGRPVHVWVFGYCFRTLQISRRLVCDQRIHLFDSYRHLHSWPQALASSKHTFWKRYLRFCIILFFVLLWLKWYVSFLGAFHQCQANLLSNVSAHTTSFKSPRFPS